MAAPHAPTPADPMTAALEPFRLELQDSDLTRWSCVFEVDELERAFRQHVYDEQIQPVLTRVLLLLIAVLVAFVAIDALVVPDVAGVAAVVRLGVLLPGWVIWVLASKHIDLRPEWVTWGGLLDTSAVVLLFLWIAASAEPPGNWLYLLYTATFSLGAPAIARWGLTISTGFTVGLAAAATGLALTLDLPRPVFVLVIVTHVVSAGFGLLIGFLVEGNARRQFVQQRLIELERARSDRLLDDVLPSSIAQRLKDGEAQIADDFDDATVLFCDLVGFTPLAGDLRASEVVALLDGVFSRFDDVVERAGLEKIKTIGDAYVVAGGVPTPRDDHVRTVADLALDLRETLRTHRPSSGAELELRIGIHRGPLVAGVIGKRRFVYDLWGDTVNVASRMESLSSPGRVLISEAVADELRPLGYVLEDRGEVDVKGKGAMPTWWLVGRPAPTTARPPGPVEATATH